MYTQIHNKEKAGELKLDDLVEELALQEFELTRMAED